jgi:SpoVK/Ycf46/Vps4 family AAA+-type ATPase
VLKAKQANNVCFNVDGNTFKMHKGYQSASFNLPVFSPTVQVDRDKTMLFYGYRHTGKSTLLRAAITAHLQAQLLSNKCKVNLSAIEVQVQDKVICMLSGKMREVSEDRKGFFKT